MKLNGAILATISASEGKLGRTSLQKLLYFENVLGLVDVQYKPHYYGPYSNEVSDRLQTLVSLDFVDEKAENFVSHSEDASHEWKRYRYSLSEDGQTVFDYTTKDKTEEVQRIKHLVKICKDTVNLDPNPLSWAAKVYFIASQEQDPVTRGYIEHQAESYGWKLTPEQINKAVDLLTRLNLMSK